MRVDVPLIAGLASLQKRYGEAWASEAGLRKIVAENTRCPDAPKGFMPGVDTIACALERLERQGVCKQVWLQPANKRTGQRADVLPTGEKVIYGTRLVYLPRNRGQRRAFAAHAARRAEENRRAVQTLVQARTEAVACVTPSLSDDAMEARRQSQLAWLREAMAREAQGLDPIPPKSDPD
jgi:hypothetical protein